MNLRKNKFCVLIYGKLNSEFQIFGFVSVCIEKAMKNREFIRFNRIVFHCKKEPNYIEAIARDQFGVFNSMLTAITSKIRIRKSFLFLFCWCGLRRRCFSYQPATFWFTVS